MNLIIMLLISSVFAGEIDLKSYSEKLNKSLPEVYDHITKLRTTSVVNNNLYYHFLVNANPEEFSEALPKAKALILKTICSQSRERPVLKQYKANLVYKYENLKGQSLGEFMILPSHCP